MAMSAGDVAALLCKVQYAGLTPLAASLQSRILHPILSQAVRGQLAKPVLVLVVTDGEPTDNPRNAVVGVVQQALRTLEAAGYGPKALAVQFCQVGKDAAAQRFLAQLDADPQIGANIDCTSYYEMEQAEYMRRGVQLSPSMWLVKMMVGAIEPEYDEADESHPPGVQQMHQQPQQLQRKKKKQGFWGKMFA